MPESNFDNSIEITLWLKCSSVNLLHIQAVKSEKYSEMLRNSLQKKLQLISS